MLAKSFFLWMVSAVSLFSFTLVTPGLYIVYPETGSVVSGIVEVRGSVPVAGFESAEISYAYEDSTSTNWFLIQNITQPIQDDILARWDTTTISDGVYQLKLSVKQVNGTVSDVYVEGIHVANYTHPEDVVLTPVNTPTFFSTIVQESSTNLNTRPTQIPENPASTTDTQLRSSIIIGIESAVVVLLLLLIYSLIRRTSRRRR